MQHVIIVVHLMLVLAMIGVVLLQKSEGGGLGIGSTGGFMSSRGTANVLTRATAFLAGGLLRHQPGAVDPGRLDRKPPASSIRRPAGQQAPGAPAPGQGGGVLDTLRQQEQAPAGPQVPRSQ